MDNQAKDIGHKILSHLEHIRTHLEVLQHDRTEPKSPQDFQARVTSGQPDKATIEPKRKRYGTLKGWKSFIELCGVLFAIGYAVVTFFQWRDLRHNFEVDERSWMKVIAPLGPMDSLLPVKVELDNVGKSIALQIQLYAIVS